MRKQSIKEERATDKADPIERRRLQNRLSQRNHRRKIRDRIAKLQERVIASELRAAASLNGWHYSTTPQTAPPPPLDPYEEKCPPELVLDHSYPPSVCASCSSSLGTPVLCSQPSSPVFDVAKEVDAGGSPLMGGSFPFGADLGMSGLCSGAEVGLDWGQGFSASSLYYVATEATLPQIMQTLGPQATRTKALVLIPQNSLSPFSSQPAEALVSMVPLQGFSCLCGGPVGLAGCPVHQMLEYPRMV